jgi:hypothetical protein
LHDVGGGTDIEVASFYIIEVEFEYFEPSVVEGRVFFSFRGYADENTVRAGLETTYGVSIKCSYYVHFLFLLFFLFAFTTMSVYGFGHAIAIRT